MSKLYIFYRDNLRTELTFVLIKSEYFLCRPKTLCSTLFSSFNALGVRMSVGPNVKGGQMSREPNVQEDKMSLGLMSTGPNVQGAIFTQSNCLRGQMLWPKCSGVQMFRGQMSDIEMSGDRTPSSSGHRPSGAGSETKAGL